MKISTLFRAYIKADQEAHIANRQRAEKSERSAAVRFRQAFKLRDAITKKLEAADED